MEMSGALVRGVHINYESVGTHGPFVAVTPGSRRPYAEMLNLSKAIAANGHRILLHDRRNSGASDVAIDGSGSEHDGGPMIYMSLEPGSALCRYTSALDGHRRKS
jgi:hypothetical protein